MGSPLMGSPRTSGAEAEVEDCSFEQPARNMANAAQASAAPRNAFNETNWVFFCTRNWTPDSLRKLRKLEGDVLVLLVADFERLEHAVEFHAGLEPVGLGAKLRGVAHRLAGRRVGDGGELGELITGRHSRDDLESFRRNPHVLGSVRIEDERVEALGVEVVHKFEGELVLAQFDERAAVRGVVMMRGRSFGHFAADEHRNQRQRDGGSEASQARAGWKQTHDAGTRFSATSV